MIEDPLPMQRAQIDLSAADAVVSDVELALGDPGYPDLAFMLSYWQEKRGSRLAPSREEIDPADFVQILPRVMLADVLATPLNFRYRLSGTGICNVHGEDLTHLLASELQPPQYGALIHGHYAQAVTEKRPLLHLIRFESVDKLRTYARLLLPLSADGVTINMLMSVDSANQNSRALQSFFDSARNAKASADEPAMLR